MAGIAKALRKPKPATRSTPKPKAVAAVPVPVKAKPRRKPTTPDSAPLKPVEMSDYDLRMHCLNTAMYASGQGAQDETTLLQRAQAYYDFLKPGLA